MYSSLIPALKEISFSNNNDQLRFGVICSQLYSEDEIFVTKFLDDVYGKMSEKAESFKSIYDRLNVSDICLFLHVLSQHPNDKRNGSIDLPTLANDVLGCHSVGNKESFVKISQAIILALLTTRYKLTAVYAKPETNSPASFVDVFIQEPQELSDILTKMALEPIYEGVDALENAKIAEVIIEFSKAAYVARIDSQDDITIFQLGVTYEFKIVPVLVL